MAMKYKAFVALLAVAWIFIGLSLYYSHGTSQARIVSTAKGDVRADELEVDVFAQNNFRVIGEADPIPRLEFINKPTCKQVFDDWLKIALAHDQYQKPPKTIPPPLLKEFLMNGHATLIEKYRNDRPEIKEHVWSQIPEWLKRPEEELYKISIYGRPGKAVYHAFKHYPLNGQVGFVIGSQEPWVEVYALLNGAKEVTTVDYQHLKIEGTDKVRYVHAVNFAQDWEKYQGSFDFAASFSSIEHSGLGRYGDPMDPIGDLREVWKTSCLLKKGGIFYLGLPRGADTVVFNYHRVYGPVRLAMIMTGFELLATFRDDSPEPAMLNRTHFQLTMRTGDFQDLFVLRKL